MGCSQSLSTVDDEDNNSLKDSMNKTKPLPIAPPLQQCEGYPFALIPKLSNDFVDINFFLPETFDGPQLSCTLTWYKGDCSSTSDNPTIDEVMKLSASRRLPVIIVCHGYCSWRNQMLLSHLATGVAEQMNCHAIRFDFQGNGSSGGKFRLANFAGELTDLQRVVNFVQQDLGCRVSCIVGHSKGSATILQYAYKQQQQQQEKQQAQQGVNGRVPCFVNMSGKCTELGGFDIKNVYSEEQCQELAETGKILVKMAGGRTVEVTQEDIDERRNFSISSMLEDIHAAVLTIHGDADSAVDVENAHKFQNTIPRHELKIIAGADHNFNGLKHMKEIVSTVAAFMRNHSE